MAWDFQNGVWGSCKYNSLEVMTIYPFFGFWVIVTKSKHQTKPMNINAYGAQSSFFFKRDLFKFFCDNPRTVCEKVSQYGAYFMPVLEFLKSVVYSPRYVDVKSNCQFVYWIICVTRTLRKLQYLGFGYEFLQTVFCIN